jgi:hypothetical protein
MIILNDYQEKDAGCTDWNLRNKKLKKKMEGGKINVTQYYEN